MVVEHMTKQRERCIKGPHCVYRDQIHDPDDYASILSESRCAIGAIMVVPQRKGEDDEAFEERRDAIFNYDAAASELASKYGDQILFDGTPGDELERTDRDMLDVMQEFLHDQVDPGSGHLKGFEVAFLELFDLQCKSFVATGRFTDIKYKGIDDLIEAAKEAFHASA